MAGGLSPIGWCMVYDPSTDAEVVMWVTRRLTEQEEQDLEQRANEHGR